MVFRNCIRTTPTVLSDTLNNVGLKKEKVDGFTATFLYM